MLDMAVRNAKILLKFKNTGRNVKISPQSSVKEFYMHLCKDYLIERFNMSCLWIDLLLGIKSIFGLDVEQMNSLRL